MADHVAHAAVTVDADPEVVWRSLTDPDRIARWMLEALKQSVESS